MPWFKVDDQFWSHPKVNDLSPEAVALWVRAGSYAAQHLTDGTVGNGTIRMLGYTRDAAVELVNAGLWDTGDEKSWVFHDWSVYQPLKESVEAEREAARERMREVRANKTRSSSTPSRSRPDPVPDPETTYVSQSSPEPKTDSPVDNSARSTLTGMGINPDRLMKEIKSHTGREVGPVAALRVALEWLDRGVNVKKPLPYLITCLRDGAVEVQQYLDQNGHGL